MNPRNFGLGQRNPFDPTKMAFDSLFDETPLPAIPDGAPGELVIRLGDGMAVNPGWDTSPYGLAAPVLELLAALRRENNLSLVQTLWSVGVRPYELLTGPNAQAGLVWAKARMSATNFNTFSQMLNTEPFAVVETMAGLNYNPLPNRIRARQYLLLSFPLRSQVAAAKAKILSWPRLSLAYVSDVPYVLPPAMPVIQEPPPDFVNPNAKVVPRTRTAPLNLIQHRSNDVKLANIAVLDTGVQTSHPYLTGNVDPWDTQETDTSGHGTTVCGVICAKPDGMVSGWTAGKTGPMPGLLPKAKVLLVQVFGQRRRSAFVLQISKLTTFLQAIIDDHPNTKDIRVLNMSFGSGLSFPVVYDHLTRLNNSARSPIVVASVGNKSDTIHGTNNILYPAAYQGLINVGALSEDTTYKVGALPEDTTYKVWTGSRTGKPKKPTDGELARRTVDCYAPGEYIWGCDMNSETRWFHGTSFAAPMVSAAIGLRLSKGNADKTVAGLTASFDNSGLLRLKWPT
jgi:hypothetical protein